MTVRARSAASVRSVTIVSTCEPAAHPTAARINASTQYSVERATRGGARSSNSIASEWNSATTAGFCVGAFGASGAATD